MIKINIYDREYFVDPKKNRIEGLAVFGSLVNGEYDKKSDIDFLVVIEDCSQQFKAKIRKSIASEMKVPVDWITIYTKSYFKGRCVAGDYFYWYLKLYSKILYSKTGFMEKEFDDMPYYTDIRGTMYHDMSNVNNMMSSYRSGSASAEDVMNSIAHFTRNACINLCYMYGILEFGKYAPAEKCMELEYVDIPFTYDEYLELYKNKRDYKYDENSFRLKGNSHQYVMAWYKKYQKFVKEILSLETKIINKNFESPLKTLQQEDDDFVENDLSSLF